MLLRYLKTIILKKTITVKQPNGSRIEEYETIGDYQVQIQEIDDEISASVYGASIVNMLRIKSPLLELEKFLEDKVNNTSDNISKYYIFIKEDKYKIKSINSKGIEIELVWKISKI